MFSDGGYVILFIYLFIYLFVYLFIFSSIIFLLLSGLSI